MIEINNESGADVDEKALADLGRFVLDAQGIDPLAEMSVLVVDAEAMAVMHQQWMDLPGPTDVMAFPMDLADGPESRFDPSAPPRTDEGVGAAMLGDVVLCPEVAAEQAKAAGHSTESELALLCTHGILHLLGYDHGEPEDEREMFELQAALLGEWTRRTGRSDIRTPVAGTRAEVRDTRAARAARRGRRG
ncbi:rRNA maturation RNase YbeY [uncultured Jatrophihabitans sp.]|uniref:rRNA maturation RNase YbeY n=1 Tax=uncultured Jatrophihabitans sp. TaxID=1610747 RepID=UPI0035CB2A18